ncbi:Retrovirus-related Pol polyprotein from transposon RE1 [Vitis vinifera]|uniref:Retrovirus-related Pol polyprotein from transposon RE1 n=1 Tax=Vitis vinifera TaxID=29760 RepID=A0A438CIN7_VITVI|nr:Retrovirus-related Pol polyprotein from transposon RE1 [Vitis vinifera]
MLGCKPLDAVMDPVKQIEEQKESTPINIERYQHPVGMLIYLSHTRLDIAFVIRIVSQYMHSPCKEHMEVVYRIIKYLKVSLGKGLFFRKNETRSIEGFTDANWASSIDDQRSTSSYCIFVWGNLATWRSKKQIVVARSSAEAEFCAIAHDMCELLWLKQLLQEINVEEKMPMKMYCDNKVTINIYHTT